VTSELAHPSFSQHFKKNNSFTVYCSYHGQTGTSERECLVLRLRGGADADEAEETGKKFDESCDVDEEASSADTNKNEQQLKDCFKYHLHHQDKANNARKNDNAITREVRKYLRANHRSMHANKKAQALTMTKWIYGDDNLREAWERATQIVVDVIKTQQSDNSDDHTAMATFVGMFIDKATATDVEQHLSETSHLRTTASQSLPAASTVTINSFTASNYAIVYMNVETIEQYDPSVSVERVPVVLLVSVQKYVQNAIKFFKEEFSCADKACFVIYQYPKYNKKFSAHAVIVNVENNHVQFLAEGLEVQSMSAAIKAFVTLEVLPVALDEEMSVSKHRVHVFMMQSLRGPAKPTSFDSMVRSALSISWLY
jgi:hypothetical protein